MQTYLSGEEVMLGDVVTRNGEDEGWIMSLQDGLPEWGLTEADSRGLVMIKWQKLGLVCENTSDNEDLQLVRRAPPST
ncbi:hypothetical protein CMV30_14450 [Nibricoccus aquaticus]|uniref:Uncharacterized protein n=1 Tax=Nibricoccus aquaticus TaxID=2576891 RepID=A0A290Q9E3_9BACT|nr:hypothetical protein [Nibricoccus aquaticus]ATC65063.1 hypothetical protein CMV30_14450 [Nibricoccus aquaticus]